MTIHNTLQDESLRPLVGIISFKLDISYHTTTLISRTSIKKGLKSRVKFRHLRLLNL